MSPTAQPVDNLTFLYRCLENHDGKKVNFAAVGRITNTQPNAARMRYTRLKARIEEAIASNKPMNAGEPRVTKREGPPKTVEKKRKATAKDEEDGFSALPKGKEAILDADREEDDSTSAEPPTKRRTRGVKIDLKSTFESDTASSLGQNDGTSDEYEVSDGGNDMDDGDDEGMSSGEEIVIHHRRKNNQNPTKTLVKGSPSKSTPDFPASPRSLPNNISQKSRFSSQIAPTSLNRTFDPRQTVLSITPQPVFQTITPQPVFQTIKLSPTPVIKELSLEEIRRDLSQYKSGMKVGLHNPALIGHSPAQSPLPEEHITEDKASITPSERASSVETDQSYNCRRTNYAFKEGLDTDDDLF